MSETSEEQEFRATHYADNVLLSVKCLSVKLYVSAMCMFVCLSVNNKKHNFETLIDQLFIKTTSHSGNGIHTVIPLRPKPLIPRWITSYLLLITVIWQVGELISWICAVKSMF